MAGATTKFIKIDLNQFKLHLYCKPDIELTLYFNSPSRRFYLTVIALVINEMKKKDKITSIPLQNHFDELILLNKTVGEEAGSSKREYLLPRIYRKWKDAIPDLENAPLFKIIGRKKRYNDLMDKVYVFSEQEQDSWANLFEYMGSHENVRLKFSIDKLSLNLEDVVIVYGESDKLSDTYAWESFIKHLEQSREDRSGSDSVNRQNFVPEPRSEHEDRKDPATGKVKRLIQFAVIGLIVTLSTFIFWQYNISVSNFEVASIEKMAFPLPEKPSIAVLAFDNLSGDPNQEYFIDGITEDIITTLSKSDSLFVVARNSTFTYKGKPVKIKQVAEELGVRYVLEGSVRKSEERVRISAQLIDAIAGNHLWAERYDREIKDIFALQDEITIKIVTALQVKLTEGEQARMTSKSNTNLDVKLKFMEAQSLWRKGTIASHMRYGQVAQEIIDMAPEYEGGYLLLGWHYWLLALSGKSPRESIGNAFNLAQKALSLNESNPFSYSLLSNLYVMMRQYDKAIAAGERGVVLNPNGADNHCALGITLSFVGKPDEAIDHLKQAIRLDPFPEYYYFIHMGRCYRMKGQYEEALSEFKKSLHVSPDNEYNYKQLASIYALLDRQEDAEAAAKKVLEVDPNFSVEHYSKTMPYKNKADLKLHVDALRKAGLPD